MLTNWFSQPAGGRSSTDDGKIETDEDTQEMEPDQGNGEHYTTSHMPWFETGYSGVMQSFLLGRFHLVEQRNVLKLMDNPLAVLSHIISQLRPGADLSRVVLPTFILEPRSMLERITKCVRLSAYLASIHDSHSCSLTLSSSFMCHPEMLLHIPTIDDPVERFVSVVKFYLSGWHIRPPFVLTFFRTQHFVAMLTGKLEESRNL